MVLARYSKYFRTLFETFDVLDEPIFVFPELREDVFEAVLYFCYHEGIAVDITLFLT